MDTRKKPDFEFTTSTGELIVVEDTRLFTRPHRALEQLALKLVVAPLQSQVSDPFVLHVDMDVIEDVAKLRVVMSLDPDVASTMSPYGYVAGNPLKESDPTGKSFEYWLHYNLGNLGPNAALDAMKSNPK